MKFVQHSTLALLVALLSACGTEDPSASSGTDDDSTKPLLPWSTGNTWTYQVTESISVDGAPMTVVTTKVNTVGDEEPVGGTGPASELVANRVVTSKQDGADETVSWQAVDGEKVVRYREQSFNSAGDLSQDEHWDPYKLRVDWSADHVVEGASWLDRYEETKNEVGMTTTTSSHSDLWTVVAVGEEVTVPAGTFKAIRVQKAGNTVDTGKNYWYVRGIGKVKETGGQTEELVDYEVAP